LHQGTPYLRIQLYGSLSMEVAERVTRRVVAEKLTKQWVMGLRRGWLKAVNPQITDYPSVLRAYDDLDTFVERLQDELRLVRKGVKHLLDDKHAPKLKAAFEKLTQQIYEARSTAKFWASWADGTAPGVAWGEDRSDDAEHMLKMYRTKFDEVSGGSVKRRDKSGLYKLTPLTHFMDKILALLRDDAAAIAKHDEAHPDDPYDPPTTFREFDLQGMKIIVDDSTLQPRHVDAYVKWLLQAKKLLQNRGFGKVWHGVIFIRCKECGGPNPNGPQYDVGGDYAYGPDTIRVYYRPSAEVMQVVIHELGHRWWFKFMTRENRLRFEEWIEGGLAPVSQYGGSNASEAFAEAFSYYVTGQKMTSDQAESFKAVALGRRLAARVARRFLASVPQS